MKKLFLITSILMLVLCLSSVCFAELTDMLYKTDLPELPETYNSLLGSSADSSTTSTGSRTTTGTTASRPSTNGSEGSRPTTSLNLIEVTIEDLTVGYELPKTFKIKTNLSDEKTFEVEKEELSVYGKWDSNGNVEANKEYTFSVQMKIGSVSVSSDFKAKINGNEVTVSRYGSRTSTDLVFSYTFKAPNERATGFRPSLRPSTTLSSGEVTATNTRPEGNNSSGRRPTSSGDAVNTRPTTSGDTAKSGDVKVEESKSGDTKPNENNMYNHFGFAITAPKIGEKPATTAKEMGEEYKVKKVEWLTTDEKFVEGETYKVQIYFDLINKNVRSDYFATVNGLVADLPNGDENYAKNTMYAEFTFPTLRDTSKKAIWTNASTWAIEELSKAAEKGLIPDSLNKEDLTKNVTRKEFAHIAVRLYEALTGKGIFVTDAPFADTDDKEIAKAYTVGITEGTDKEKKLFSPDKEITREQMATMMSRALDKAYVDTFVDLTKVTKFADDADLHDWSRDAVYFMANAEIIKGVGNNNFGAKGTATREQALLVAIRSLEKFIK